MRQDETLLEYRDVDFSYDGEKVLEEVCLVVKRGDFLGVIGPNGSGRTTLIKIGLGLLVPTSGKVVRNARVGYVAQKQIQMVSKFPISAEEVVGLAVDGKNEKDVIEMALSRMRMEGKRRRLMSELSGGEQQRVLIAQALANGPELLVLDEPTVGVDSETQLEFYSILSKLNKEGTTIVLVSHDIDVVAHEVSSVACMNKRLVFHGSPKEGIRKEVLETMYGRGLKLVIHGH